MLAALKKRLVVEKRFENPEDARLLIKMSGGCIRDLMHLVNIAQKSRVRLDQPLTQLTTAGINRAMAEYRLVLREGLEETDCARLVEVARQKSWEDKFIVAPFVKTRKGLFLR